MPTPEQIEEQIEAAAKAIYEGPLSANDEENFGDNAASDWCREVARATLTAAASVDDVGVQHLPRADVAQKSIGWTLPCDLLAEVGSKVREDGWDSPTLEVIEIVMLETERRILSALEAASDD